MSTPTTPNTELQRALELVLDKLETSVVYKNLGATHVKIYGIDTAINRIIQLVQNEITQAERRAELKGGLKELRGLPGKAPFVKADGMIATVNDRRTELLAELLTLQENQANE